MMFIKPKKPRRFEYTPLFYDPEKDKKSGRREIHFRRLRSQSESGGKSMLLYLILFLLTLFIYWYTKN